MKNLPIIFLIIAVIGLIYSDYENSRSIRDLRLSVAKVSIAEVSIGTGFRIGNKLQEEQPIGEYCLQRLGSEYNSVTDGYHLTHGKCRWHPFTASQVVDEHNGSKKIRVHNAYCGDGYCHDWIDAKYIFLYKDYIGEMRMRDRDAMERKIRGGK